MIANLPIAFTYATAKELGLSDYRLRVLPATRIPIAIVSERIAPVATQR